MEKNKKHGNKNALLFVAILVLFLVIVGVVCYGFFMSINMKKDAVSDGSKLEMVVDSKEDTNINSNGDPIIEYDKTSDWNQDVIYVASLLNISMVNADDVMHQVSALCEANFSSKLYFFNRFEKIEGTDNEYRIMSGDSMYALRVSIVISDDSIVVNYIDEVDVAKWKNEVN